MSKKNKRIFITLAVVLILVGGAFAFLLPYHKSQVAVETSAMGDRIVVDDNLISLTPLQPNGKGFIFYAGAKVEELAYLPMLEQLMQQGVTVVIAKMPFHLAIFDVNAADDAMEAFPDIKNWYIGGHSLGGAMASKYMSENPDKLQGLMLMGAYIYGEVPVDKVLTVWASNDTVMDKSKITYTQNVIVVEGGNHAGFGYYGEQNGDGIPTISAEEQQRQTANAMLMFMGQ